MAAMVRKIVDATETDEAEKNGNETIMTEKMADILIQAVNDTFNIALKKYICYIFADSRDFQII